MLGPETYLTALRPTCAGGVYVNFMPSDDNVRMSEAYGSNIDKLRQIKGKYDPNNLFRLNHNVDVAEGVTLTT